MKRFNPYYPIPFDGILGCAAGWLIGVAVLLCFSPSCAQAQTPTAYDSQQDAIGHRTAGDNPPYF